MTGEQRKALSDRLEQMETKERGLWADLEDKRAKKDAASTEWLIAHNEVEWLKSFAAIPEEPVAIV